MLPLNQMLTVDKLLTDKVIFGTMILFGVLGYTQCESDTNSKWTSFLRVL